MQVNTATSATEERSFSTARWMKTWICSTMNQERFNNVSLLNIHKSRLNNLNLVEVANQFTELNEYHHQDLKDLIKVILIALNNVNK